MKTVRLLVGTVQSVFFLRGPAARTAWQVGRPHLAVCAIYALVHDGREWARAEADLAHSENIDRTQSMD